MIYEHRNAQTEAPEVAGNYWFIGVDKNSPQYGIKEMVTVRNEDNQLWVWVPAVSVAFECGYSTLATNLAGQWWGPFFAPWEVTEK